MSNLTARIKAFLDKHAMEATRLGVAAANDSHLIHDILAQRRKPRRVTIRKIEDFMRAYKSTKRK